MKKKRSKSKWRPLIWGRVPDISRDRKRWNKTDWAECGIIFFFLIGAVVALGLTGALLMGLISKFL